MTSLPRIYKTERMSLRTHVLLDANEHYHQWVNIPNKVLSTLNRYPDKSALALRLALASKYCYPLTPSNIFISSGSIEAIDLLIASYTPKKILINTPSYDVYSLRATAHRVPIDTVPLDKYGQPNINKLI